MGRLGSSLAVVAFTQLGSSVSLRGFSRLGSSVAVFDFANFGASFALRSFSRIGSAMSLFGCSRIGSSLSVLGCAHVGSSVSLRRYVRLGSGLSLGGDLRVPNYIKFENANTYMMETGSGLEFYVSGAKAMTMENDGGILHGSWNSESVFVTSDRRLKTDIKPLQRTLRQVVTIQPTPKASRQLSGAAPNNDGALWLLRQLRPVSYSFRKGAESKYMRFGFIADELESVVPQIVRTVGDRDVADQKAVVYQDLIALLAAAAQSQQSLIQELKSEMATSQSEMATSQQELRAELQALRLDFQRVLQDGSMQELEEFNATNITNVTTLNTSNRTHDLFA
jgi:hypothetical protein